MFKEEFKDKRVILWRKNGFKFEGVLLGENHLGVFIDDIKKGKMFIPFDEISEIVEVSE